MQRGQHMPDFARATNERNLGCLGDPERWGGFGTASIDVVAVAPTDATRYTQQIVRAQTADLIARAWDISAYYLLSGADAADAIDLALHIVWGSGQANAEGYAQLPIALIVPAGAFPWLSSPAGGALVFPQPIPAAAIAIRARLHVVAAGAAPLHTVSTRVHVCIAPRAL